MRLFGWKLSRAAEPVDTVGELRRELLAEIQQERVELLKESGRVRDLINHLEQTLQRGLTELHQGITDIDIRPQVKIDQPAPQVTVNTAQFDAVLGQLDEKLRVVDARITQAVAKVTAESQRNVELAGEQLRQLISLPEAQATIATGYQRILREKGQAGLPRKCDVCGSIFSDRLDSCDRCGRRKNEMPQSTLLEG